MTDPTAPLVDVRGLAKSFGGDTPVLRGVDFQVGSGTTTVVLGPSGSGKTTILRSLNVLETPDAGVVRIGDVEVDFGTLPAKGKDTRGQTARLRAQSGMVFQAHNLFPHKTVLENVIEGPVQVQKRPRDEAVAEAHALLAQVGLSEKAEQHPFQLSGGQQQRVGIARALALKPKVVLFDQGPRDGGVDHRHRHARDPLRRAGGRPGPLPGRRPDRRAGPQRAGHR
jgi:cystine transport system ATP-binding protein